MKKAWVLEGYYLDENFTDLSHGPFHCKLMVGDSGGAFWRVENGKAFLVGVTNRGRGCARKDSMGIYAKIAYHR